MPAFPFSWSWLVTSISSIFLGQPQRGGLMDDHAVLLASIDARSVPDTGSPCFFFVNQRLEAK
jgi:hypothetical protein